MWRFITVFMLICILGLSSAQQIRHQGDGTSEEVQGEQQQGEGWYGEEWYDQEEQGEEVQDDDDFWSGDDESVSIELDAENESGSGAEAQCHGGGCGARRYFWVLNMKGGFTGSLDQLLGCGNNQTEIGRWKGWREWFSRTANCQSCPCSVPANLLGEICFQPRVTGSLSGECRAWVQLDINNVLLQYFSFQCRAQQVARNRFQLQLLADNGVCRGQNPHRLELRIDVEPVFFSGPELDFGQAQLTQPNALTLSGQLQRNRWVRCRNLGDLSRVTPSCRLNCGDIIFNPGLQNALIHELKDVLNSTCDCICIPGASSWTSEVAEFDLEQQSTCGSGGECPRQPGCGCCMPECCNAFKDYLNEVGPCWNVILENGNYTDEETAKIALLLDPQFQQQQCSCTYSIADGADAVCRAPHPPVSEFVPDNYRVYCSRCRGDGGNSGGRGGNSGGSGGSGGRAGRGSGGSRNNNHNHEEYGGY